MTADGLTQPSEQSVFWCDAEQSRPNAATCATKRNVEKHRMAEWKLETDTVLVYIAKDTFSNLLKPVFFFAKALVHAGLPPLQWHVP